MSAPSSLLRAPGARKSKAPEITKQADRHTALASLLLRAEAAPDSTERCLAVLRALLHLLVDALRPGRGFQDAPAVVLGHHALSHRDLAERHRGDALRLFLQEVCTYDPEDAVTRHHPKFHSQGLTPVASLTASLTPRAAVRVQRTGLIGGAGAPYLEVDWRGCGTVVLARHAEQYRFTLPALLVGEPLAETSPLDFGGELSLECGATGLSASLRFKPWRGRAVKGAVTRLSGELGSRLAGISGDWAGRLEVASADGDAAGVLFDARELVPPPATSVRLGEPGPRLVPRLWSSLLEALMYVDVEQAAALGKRAEAVAAGLPGALQRSLGYEAAEGPKPSAAARADANAEGEAPAGDGRALPPAAKAQRALGRSLKYTVHYDLVALDG